MCVCMKDFLQAGKMLIAIKIFISFNKQIL